MMENPSNELRITQRHRKKSLSLPRSRYLMIILMIAPVACFVWEIQNTERGSIIFELYKRRFAKCIEEKLGLDLEKTEHMKRWLSNISHETVPSNWGGYCVYSRNVLFILFVIWMTKLENIKLLSQTTIEIFNMCRFTSVWPNALFFCFTLFLPLVIYSNLENTFQLSLEILQYPLHLRVAEDPAVNENDIRFHSETKNVTPHVTVNVTRYNTEDVLLECYYIHIWNITTTEEQASMLIWTKDGGMRVTESDRIRINTTIWKYPEEALIRVVFIRSVLTIELIGDDDYGTYSCKYFQNINEEHLLPRVDAFHQCMHILPFASGPGDDLPGFHPFEPREFKFGLNLKEQTCAIFHLQKQDMPVATVKVSPGGLFIEHVSYWTLADPRDITVKKSIREKNNNTCCSMSAFLYTLFIGYDYSVWRFPRGTQHQWYLIRQQCICLEDLMLNNSTAAFLRTRYNSTTKRQEVFEVGQPRKVVLIPAIPVTRNLYPVEDESLWLSDDYQTCAKTNDTSPVCRTRYQSIIDAFDAMKTYDTLYWIFCFVALFILLKTCKMIVPGWMEYLITFKKVFIDPVHDADHYKYDMYLTYDEEDRYERKVAKSLREYVTGPRFSVFDPWIDIELGRHTSNEQEKAILQSRTFCVIISDQSENDEEKKFEVAAIKKTLAARASSDTDISDNKLIIQIGECIVDKFLSPVDIKISDDDRKENVLEQNVLEALSIWMLRSKLSWKSKHSPENKLARHYSKFLSAVKFSFIYLCFLLFLVVSPELLTYANFPQEY